ncbi:peptidase domain-containing ABC transporter [Natronospirillum operosum]|uniref:peptidase domain-containing ABC transporter n=1 Tax=Natronospirillum operosum TaxID=2759953 RepID=UPI00143697E6|nr:peptidase domain-containing ABC transporter [Natronospirillum operosum]
MALSDEGDTYLVSAEEDGSVTLRSYFHIDEVVDEFSGTWSELKKELDLCSEVLVIQYTESTPGVAASKSGANSTAGGSHYSSSYVTDHFLNHKRYAWGIIGISVVLALLGVATPLGFQTFADKILPYSAINSLVVVVVLLLLAAVATSVFQCFHDYQESVLFAKYQNGLGKEVFRRLMAMDVPFFDQRKVGDLTKLVDQVQEASNFLVKQMLSSVVAVISLLVVLPILFVYSVQLSLVVLAIGFGMAFTVGVALRPLRNRVKQAYGYDASFQSVLIETLKGMRTIKSLANESHFRHRANTSLEHNLYGGFNVARFSNVVGALVNFQSQLITIAVIFFGAQAVFAQQMTIGQLIAFNMLANNVVNPLVSLVMTAHGWENFRLARRKLAELTPPEPPALQLSGSQVDLEGDIEFRDLWFRYPVSADNPDEDEQAYVLRDVNLTIRQGEIIGIVGGSGSGKSTLANLLMGFYAPTRGKVLINGHDLALVSPDTLRSRISSVQQTSFLFNTSVVENVYLGRLDSGLEDIQQALEESGSQDFVDSLPQKFMTPLSEDGGNLSGGQRQRLAIARALVRNSDILLFDEATSALDNETEDTIKETIYAACQDKTGIIIAHRLNTLSYCDRIVVMQAGTIEAVGTHDELLQSDNSYHRMWQSMLRRDEALTGMGLEGDSEVVHAV